MVRLLPVSPIALVRPDTGTLAQPITRRLVLDQLNENQS
jgi:hypothetical protein